MRKHIWLLIAVFLILAGCIMGGCVMAKLNWDFTKLSTVKYMTTEHTIGESFRDISVVTDTAEVVFEPTDGPTGSVICREQQDAKHSVAVKDGTLVIAVAETRKWYDRIGINFGAPKITVFLPRGEYGALSVKTDTGAVEIPEDFRFARMDISEHTGLVTSRASVAEAVKVHTTTGNIRLENITAAALDLSVSTGKITVSGAVCSGDVSIRVSTGNTILTDIACKNLSSTGSTGDLSLTNVIAAEEISVRRSTGVRFLDSDAGEITVQTDTGKVTGTLLSPKVFLAESDTGRVLVPNTTTGGTCRIQTDTGSILLEITGG